MPSVSEKSAWLIRNIDAKGCYSRRAHLNRSPLRLHLRSRERVECDSRPAREDNPRIETAAHALTRISTNIKRRSGPPPGRALCCAKSFLVIEAASERLDKKGCATNLWVKRTNRVHEPPRIHPSERLVGSSA